MKVLAKGRTQTGWSKELTCTGAGNGGGACGAKLLVEQADLYRTSGSHYDGSTESYVTFRCPDCGVETDTESAPPSVTDSLPAKKTWLAKQRDPVFGRPPERDGVTHGKRGRK